MENKEPLVRSDWTTYRGGAIFCNGTEDCSLEDCFIDQVGGNAVFVNNYNRRLTVRGCHIAEAGANGVAFVGDRDAARVPRDWNDHSQTPGEPGPHARPEDRQLPGRLPGGRLPDLPVRAGSRSRPRRCEIDLSQGITVRHCSHLRRAAGRHQHRRRLLGRPRDRVLRHLRHGQGNRRPRLVQFLGPRPLLGAAAA